MKKRKWFLSGILLFALISAGSGWGAEKKPLLGRSGKNSDQPLHVTSLQMEADNKNMIITFTGNVVATQGEMIIHADATNVYYEKTDEGNEVREIVATGNVKIQEGDRLATSEKAVFTNADQRIVLTGKPKVWQGKDMVSGDKIIVLLDEDKSFVESGSNERVEVIFYPKGGKSKEKR